jgi:hypothetical protein
VRARKLDDTTQIGDHVLAYDQVTDSTGSYTVTAVLIHTDRLVEELTIDSETITTTPNHRFFTVERGWIHADELRAGDHVRKVNGSSGVVHNFVLVMRPQMMYNLTVAHAHTFFVGDGWLVHNTGCNLPKDFPTKNTKNWSAQFSSEGEARAFARRVLGKDPIEFEPNKLRSQSGKWQYRARPGDVADLHVHLEELDIETGEVLQNLHLRWPEGGVR